MNPLKSRSALSSKPVEGLPPSGGGESPCQVRTTYTIYGMARDVRCTQAWRTTWVSRGVLPAVLPSGSGRPGEEPVREADPRQGRRARLADRDAGGHARLGAHAGEGSPAGLCVPDCEPVQGIHLAGAAGRVPAPAAPAAHLAVEIVLRRHGRGGQRGGGTTVPRHPVWSDRGARSGPGEAGA